MARIQTLFMFQSTPPRGRRHNLSRVFSHCACFNPRLREGGDQATTAAIYDRMVSIHASAREATAVFALTFCK